MASTFKIIILIVMKLAKIGSKFWMSLDLFALPIYGPESGSINGTMCPWLISIYGKEQELSFVITLIRAWTKRTTVTDKSTIKSQTLNGYNIM